MSRPRRIFVSGRVKWKRHPHCKFPPSELSSFFVAPTHLDQLRLSSTAPNPPRGKILHNFFLHNLSSSSIPRRFHTSGARARWRFFNTGRLSTMRNTRVRDDNITAVHPLTFYSGIRGLPPNFQDVSHQGWPLRRSERHEY